MLQSAVQIVKPIEVNLYFVISRAVLNKLIYHQNNFPVFMFISK